MFIYLTQLCTPLSCLRVYDESKLNYALTSLYKDYNPTEQAHLLSGCRRCLGGRLSSTSAAFSMAGSSARLAHNSTHTQRDVRQSPIGTLQPTSLKFTSSVTCYGCHLILYLI